MATLIKDRKLVEKIASQAIISSEVIFICPQSDESNFHKKLSCAAFFLTL